MKQITVCAIIYLMIKPKESTNPDRIKKALKVATQYHEGQFRKTGEPYINHPKEVEKILHSWHIPPPFLLNRPRPIHQRFPLPQSTCCACFRRQAPLCANHRQRMTP